MLSRRLFTFSVLILLLAVQFVPVEHAAAASYCDWAQFVADVTVPDGTNYAPGTTFTKTWRLKNIGTCTWSASYALVFDSGTQMGASAAVNFPSSVAPGGTVDLTVDMTAPNSNGSYRGYWKLRNASNVLFGIGSTANKDFWVDIKVTSASQTGYDFVANAGSAVWSSGAGVLSFPGTDGDSKGYVIKKDAPKLENGTTASAPGLLTAPQNIYNGYIQGAYPAFTVQSGDRFQSIVNCEYGATNCYVTFRLDYQIGNGPIKTYWAFRERYEGLYYNADIDLTPLAGYDVKFILTILAYGPASGDKALWGAPRIVRAGSGGTVTPTPTGTPPTSTPGGSCTDRAQFIADVNVPDGTVFAPNTAFTKIWRLKNVGTCTWSSYTLVFDSGEQMSGSASVNLPSTVVPGGTVDVTTDLTSPNNAGTYRGYYKLRSGSGHVFGIGSTYDKSFWVEIKVSGSTSGAGYDFLANACSATWVSGAGTLPCPGTDGDSRGFVLKKASAKLENGVTDSRGGLITFPQNIYNGYIQGIYPAFTVQSGDRFQSIVNCEYGATNCYVTFRLDYKIGDGPVKTFWAFRERYEGLYYTADLDLSSLAGQNVKFILTVLASGYSSGDRALWVAPMIYRTGSSPATATPTVTGTSPSPTATQPTATATQPTATATTVSTSNWNTYTNNNYSFQFKFPPGSNVSAQSNGTDRITLPLVTSGTNLGEKYVDVTVVEGANPCKSPDGGGTATTSENVTINSIPFLKETGSDAAAGNIYDWVAYSTVKADANNACISMTFVLHSTNPGNYQTPPPEFDKPSESAVFDLIIDTFGWIQ
jgi:hypothetical protein